MTERNDLVSEVIDGRRDVYGDPTMMYGRTAEVWSGVLGVPVTAEQVVLCMMGMKLVRTAQTPDYADNSDDIEGYLDIFRELVGGDMVPARSVSEYLKLKEQREDRERWTAPIEAARS